MRLLPFSLPLERSHFKLGIFLQQVYSARIFCRALLYPMLPPFSLQLTKFNKNYYHFVVFPTIFFHLKLYTIINSQ